MTTPTHHTVADLHVHTTVSDGRLEIEDIPKLAKRADLLAVGITDHDRIHPWFASPVTKHTGITLIRGIELRVERDDGERFDLLGYAVEETAALRQLIDRIQTARVERAGRMIEAIETRLGIALEIDVGPGIGRPHIARAVAAHPDTPHTAIDVFQTLIGNGKPCYVSRWVPTLDQGISILTDASKVVSLAHPLRYADVEGAIAIARRVGAIERWYPYEEAVSTEQIDGAVDQYDLLPTGGSDSHERTVGTTGVPRNVYESFANVCGIPTPSEP